MNKKKNISFIVFLLLCLAWNFIHVKEARSQSDNKGTDFWVCFPQNAKNEFNAGLQFKLFLTGNKAAKGSVVIPGLHKTIPFSFEASQIIPINIDTAVQIMSSGKIENSGIHVVSDVPIAVYGLSNRKASTDTYVAYPTNVLGTAYRAMCYDPLLGTEDAFTSQITIVATEDKTDVAVNLLANVKSGERSGEVLHITLGQGEVYQLQGTTRSGVTNSDLTGTLVTSNKPIAFFTGHTCAQVPSNVNFCDQLLEEETPINTWGKQFFLSKMTAKQEYALRVVANENDTKVFLDEKFVKNLDAGEFYENNHVSQNVMITSDKPVLVGQYAQSSDADPVKVGDPFMMIIAPTEQFLSSYRFVTPVKGAWHHYLNIIVPSNAINSLRIDGNAIAPDKFSLIGITKYSIAQYEIGYGSHSMTCDRPFGLYSYGFGVEGDNYDSYGNCAGQRIARIDRVADTARPTLELVESKRDDEIELIARDDRINDLGLGMIMISDSSNKENPIFYPVLDIGSPELRFSIKKTSLASCIYIELRDFAKNQINYALCPASPNSTNATNEAAKYNLTPLLLAQELSHDVYPVEIYPSPAKYGQPVNINFTNATPEVISVHVLDEGGNIVTMLQDKQMTGNGKHSLIYLSDKYPSGSYFLRFMAFSSGGVKTYQQDAHFVVAH